MGNVVPLDTSSVSSFYQGVPGRSVGVLRGDLQRQQGRCQWRPRVPSAVEEAKGGRPFRGRRWGETFTR